MHTRVCTCCTRVYTIHHLQIQCLFTTCSTITPCVDNPTTVPESLHSKPIIPTTQKTTLNPCSPALLNSLLLGIVVANPVGSTCPFERGQDLINVALTQRTRKQSSLCYCCKLSKCWLCMLETNKSLLQYSIDHTMGSIKWWIQLKVSGEFYLSHTKCIHSLFLCLSHSLTPVWSASPD